MILISKPLTFSKTSVSDFKLIIYKGKNMAGKKDKSKNVKY